MSLKHSSNLNADPLMDRADILVKNAETAAAAAFQPMEAKFAFIKTVIKGADDRKWWDIVLTIAAVYIAAARLQNLEVGEARETALMTKVTERLLELNPNAIAAFDDCKEFFDRTYDALTASNHEERFIASDSIGLWIAWNLLDRTPESQDEWAFVRAIGAVITHGFFNWWGQKG
jgi:hypothetical protein